MFKVMKEQCDQCLFSKSRIVSVKRRAEILKTCARDDSHFICHKASMRGDNVCCRAFFDRHSTNLIRIAGRLGAIEFVEYGEKENGDGKRT